MDIARDAQSLLTRPCCVESNFQFVTETPSRGSQPGQRFHIRSHVMKRYKQNQRREQQLKTSLIHQDEGQGQWHVSATQQDVVNGVGSGENVRNLKTSAYPKIIGAEADKTQDSLRPLKVVDRSRPANLASKQSISQTKTIFTDYSSSKQGHVYNASRSRCPYCGAPQVEILEINEGPSMEPSATNSTVLWRKMDRSFPLEPLGAGRVDPFRSYPVDEASLCLHELMDHG
jgi:hypothetical protein